MTGGWWELIPGLFDFLQPVVGKDSLSESEEKDTVGCLYVLISGTIIGTNLV